MDTHTHKNTYTQTHTHTDNLHRIIDSIFSVRRISICGRCTPGLTLPKRTRKQKSLWCSNSERTTECTENQGSNCSKILFFRFITGRTRGTLYTALFIVMQKILDSLNILRDKAFTDFRFMSTLKILTLKILSWITTLFRVFVICKIFITKTESHESTKKFALKIFRL